MSQRMPLRAVIYCRCSTEEESQKDALAKQVKEAQECVKRQGWILTDAYVESRSGTSTKGRTQYNRLYENLLTDSFDVIVIKSQDRLMRNTKDWYLFVDRLTASLKKLYIYIEQKYYSPDDALITGIKAILAEDYSRELSKKINNAHINRQKNGSAVILTNNTYGYQKQPDKSVVILEEEAKIKRRMYELCAAGYGSRTIADILKKDGVRNRKGKPFSDTDIRRMIRNPINKGTVVMHQTHYDFDTKKTVKIPKEEQFVYENRIPAIVSEELWDRANEKISSRRTKIQEDGSFAPENKPESGAAPESEKSPGLGKNPGKSVLSGKLFCGFCGEPYYRSVRRKYKTGEKVYQWKCKSYLQFGRNSSNRSQSGRFESSTSQSNRSGQGEVRLGEGQGCDNIHLEEEKLWKLLQQIYEGSYDRENEKIVLKMLSLVKEVLTDKAALQEIQCERLQQEQLLSQMDVLLDKLLGGIISDEIYQKKQRALDHSLKAVQEKIKIMDQNHGNSALFHQRFRKIEKYLREGEGVARAMVCQILEEVERITIFPNFFYMTFYDTFDTKKLSGVRCVKIDTVELTHKLRVDYGSTFDYLAQKKEEREALVELMRKNPGTTAGEIAQELKISRSSVNYKIKALEKDGRIQFHGAGGKGYWEILEK